MGLEVTIYGSWNLKKRIATECFIYVYDDLEYFYSGDDTKPDDHFVSIRGNGFCDCDVVFDRTFLVDLVFLWIPENTHCSLFRVPWMTDMIYAFCLNLYAKYLNKKMKEYLITLVV